MNEIKQIVICKHCGKPEYYGKMCWLSGICSCRDCFKAQYERKQRKIYIWKDIDGARPTLEEYYEQEKKRGTLIGGSR